MNENILTILSLLCLLIGVMGSVLPVLPGSVLSWLGLVLLKYTSHVTYGWTTLIILAIFVLIFQVINYFLPGYSSKRLGGSKYSSWGATIGLVVGVFFAPFGLISIILMPFIGAFLGEFLFVKRDFKISLRTALGSLIGLVISNGLNLMLTLSFLFFAIWQLSQNSNWEFLS